METKVLWVNPVQYNAGTSGSRKVEIFLKRLTREQARVHLELHYPDGIIIGVERGPRGGWTDARYFLSGQLLAKNPRLEWYMVKATLVQLSGQMPVSTGT